MLDNFPQYSHTNWKETNPVNPTGPWHKPQKNVPHPTSLSHPTTMTTILGLNGNPHVSFHEDSPAVSIWLIWHSLHLFLLCMSSVAKHLPQTRPPLDPSLAPLLVRTSPVSKKPSVSISSMGPKSRKIGVRWLQNQKGCEGEPAMWLLNAQTFTDRQMIYLTWTQISSFEYNLFFKIQHVITSLHIYPRETVWLMLKVHVSWSDDTCIWGIAKIQQITWASEAAPPCEVWSMLATNRLQSPHMMKCN